MGFLRTFATAAIVTAFFMSQGEAAPAQDRVKTLPLLTTPLPSKHYSGYLQGNNGAWLHYYLVEAIDVDPATAPTVWWTNGGPGCSSMDGWGYELGPFHFKNYNTSGPVFTLNEFTWAKKANVVFVENPPGVGFSWRENGNYTITDTENAADSYTGLLDLLNNKFPEYKNNKLYLAGESYGGIYIPTLAGQILAHGGVNNFAGMLVGNGVTSQKYDDNFLTSDGLFAVTHGFMSKEAFAAAEKACVDPSTAACQKIVGDYYTMTENLNIYDSYGHCFTIPDKSWLGIPALRRRLEHYAKRRGMTVRQYLAKVPPSPPSGDAGLPCVDFEVMKHYLNRGDVKAALHVPGNLHFDLCYDINYISNVPTVVPVYEAMLAAGKEVLIYNGNTDMAVPYTGTESWIAGETSWNVTRKFSSWNLADPAYIYGRQLGGFARQYEGKIWFVTVQGAGHMVPQYRPGAALDMFERFITGKGF